jgi:molybdopterin/thiamine biosynthesis adenylyltransferase
VARVPLNPPANGWSLVIPPRHWDTLTGHLFTGWGEHGAVLLTEQVPGPRGPRLLVRRVILAENSVDYIPGTTGFRALAPHFVRDSALLAYSKGMVYIAVHNHGGFDRVRFSEIDLASHERGYPALVQLTGNPVAGLVLTPGAAAGDIWCPGGDRADLAELVIPGRCLARLRPKPATSTATDDRWDRQARVYGDAGQNIFSQMRVAVVGLGGAGSLIAEFIARLGVGHLTLIDADVVTVENLPRLVGAEPYDIGQPKTTLAARNARRANADVQVDELIVEVQHPDPQAALRQCDFIFLAADSNAARHFVNKIVEEHLIPGVQVGVKVPVEDDGTVGRIHTAVRPLIPGNGCLRCNGLINATELALDMAPTDVRRAARYVDEVPAPSVIALNAVAVAEAVNVFMLGATGLLADDDAPYVISFPRQADVQLHSPRRDKGCSYCGEVSEPTSR